MNKFGYGPEKIQLSELEEINLYESIQILNEISLCELKQFTFFFISDKNSSDDTKHHLSSVENSEYSQRDPLVLILQVERIFLDFSQVFQEITYLWTRQTDSELMVTADTKSPTDGGTRSLWKQYRTDRFC